ncbi:MAG: NADP(H)-dependent aldo-keto reductase [Gammaproteobacteria bacterium]
MRFKKLGGSDLNVSEICLGTMTFGQQNTEAESFEQLDAALAHGVNFIDTAEMYPIPADAGTYGQTERIIGNWLKKTGNRDKIVLASKVVGRADWLPHVRGGKACLDKKNIDEALEQSLKRLQTDYLDLYQVHWPDRKTNFFGKLGYVRPEQDSGIAIETTLTALADWVKAGKVRYLGISNETPWGTLEYLRIAKELGLPRIISIQNPYSLLNRSFEVGLAEVSDKENIDLLAYSPLGFGTLTGKYIDSQPENARLTLFPGYRRYYTENGIAATRDYVALARKFGLHPAQMALAYVAAKPFVGSTIIGATTLAQLKENLEAFEMGLSDDVVTEIETVHQRYPNPCP